MPKKEEKPAPQGVMTPPTVLSPRELETAVGLARGDTCRDVAEMLGISVKTIDTHRQHVLKKLGLRNAADVARWAVNWGLVEVPRVVELLQRGRDVAEVDDPDARAFLTDVVDYLALIEPAHVDAKAAG